jgi:hypothetical protein
MAVFVVLLTILDRYPWGNNNAGRKAPFECFDYYSTSPTIQYSYG